jgi:putative inorganic carbon (hco3(-)) transporter
MNSLTWRDFPFIFIALPILVLALLFPGTITGLGASALLALYALISPKNGLLMLLLYFPTRPFLIEINPSLKMAGDLIILAAFASVAFAAIRSGNWRSLFKFQIFEWAFFGFLLVGAVSAYITGVPIGVIVFQLRAFVITYIVYYVVKRLDITKEDILKFLWTTFLMAILLSLHGLVEKMSLRSYLMPEKWVGRSLSYNNRVRIYGLIDNPNVLAVYLSMAVMLTIYLKQFYAGKTKLILNIGMILMLGVITLTYSRGTWIGFIIALAVYLAATKNWRRTGNIFVAAVLSIILINIPATQVTNYFKNAGLGENIPRDVIQGDDNPDDEQPSDEERRFKETFEMSTVELSKTTGRLFIVNKGFEIFKDHPVIGTGFATFGDSAAKGNGSPIYEEYGINFNIYSDNQYIQIIAQTGAVGVILFAIFLLGMLFFIWKKRNVTRAAIPVLAVLVGVYVVGVLYNIWEDKTFTTYFFMMLAAVAHGINYKGWGKNESPSSH